MTNEGIIPGIENLEIYLKEFSFFILPLLVSDKSLSSITESFFEDIILLEEINLVLGLL